MLTVYKLEMFHGLVKRIQHYQDKEKAESDKVKFEKNHHPSGWARVVPVNVI